RSVAMEGILRNVQVYKAVVGQAAAAMNASFRDEASVTSTVSRADLNNLKIVASELSIEICLQALEVCGIRGYLNACGTSVGRHIRDALSAPIMISNWRLR